MIARMSYTAPDPLATGTPDYPTGPKVSTFRITSMPQVEFEFTIIQDYRTKSVLNGFSGIGGLGSLSSFFVILFGNTLLGIVYRTLFTLMGTGARILTNTRRNKTAYTLRHCS